MSPPAARLPSAERRTQIVEAALPVFAHLGFDRVTMEAIARAAGVDKVIVYRQFGTVAAVYDAVMDTALARVAEHFPNVAETDVDPESLRRGLLNLLGGIRRDLDPWVVVTTAPVDPDARATWSRARDVIGSTVRTRVATRGAELGVFANQREADWMADFLFGALSNSITEQVRRHSARRDREYVDFLIRYFDAVRGDDDTAFQAVRPRVGGKGSER